MVKAVGTSSNDVGNGIALNGSGMLYITGNTNAGSNDIFIMKLDASGAIQ